MNSNKPPLRTFPVILMVLAFLPFQLLRAQGISVVKSNDIVVSKTGDDANSGTLSAPFLTLQKALDSWSPGKRIFIREGKYNESVRVMKSGRAGDTLVVCNYPGETATITGEYHINKWKSSTNNLHRTASVIRVPTLNVVVLDHELRAMGRYPNKGYLTIDSHVASSGFSSANLEGGLNWTGAEAVARKRRWILARMKIYSQSGANVKTLGSKTFDYRDRYGFFIQDDIRTLDLPYEWYHHKGERALSVVGSGTIPKASVANREVLMHISNGAFITVKGIHFEFANTAAVIIQESADITLDSCFFAYCYEGVRGQNYEKNGIDTLVSRNLTIKNSRFSNILNNGVWTNTEFYKVQILANTFDSIGVLPGMGGSEDGSYNGIRQQGGSAYIAFNRFNHIGYQPITFNGHGSEVAYNVMDSFCFVKDDGGGIYTANAFFNRKIHHNIIGNGIGAGEGTGPKTRPWHVVGAAEGIYLDNGSQHVQVWDNTVYNVANHTLLVHNNTGGNSICNNLFYSCNAYDASVAFVANETHVKQSGNVFAGNRVVVLGEGQHALYLEAHANGVEAIGRFDKNVYAKPATIHSKVVKWKGTAAPQSVKGDLSQWQAFSQQDKNSVQRSIPVNGKDAVLLQFNPSMDTVYYVVTKQAEDLYGNKVKPNDRIPIFPYQSILYVFTP